MEINGKEYLSPQEQLFENTKDIEKLKQIIKPVYQTTATLTSSSVSVALTDTNVGDATEGWLMTTDGLLFKITANDGTTVLLIYYADLKGPQGPAGSDLYIDDTTIVNNKVWSSQKTHNTLDKGIYFALDEPTENDGVYTYTRLTLANINTNVPIQQDDLIISFDATDISNIKSANMWKVEDSSDPDTLTVSLVGAVGGGKQLYQHNITCIFSTVKLLITITNDSNTQLNASSILQWLKEKGFRNDNYQGIYYNEAKYINSGSYNGCQITYNSDTSLGYMLFTGTGSAVTLGDFTITDQVAEL